ncbi:MAG: HD-GYP domain-containing protein [Bacillota bacterium]
MESLVEISEVEPGATLAKTIYTSSGTILLRQGVKLSESHLQKLYKLGIYDIYIEEPEEEVKEEVTDKKELTSQNLENEILLITRQSIEQIDLDNNRFSFKDYQDLMELIEIIANNISQIDKLLEFINQLKDLEDESLSHLVNVTLLSLIIGKKLDYSKMRLERLGLGAFLHDIGKINVPASILNKPSKLNNIEYQEIKKHTVYGYEILKEIDEIPKPSARVAYQHHEYCDGTGYPKGLKKRFINDYSRIVAIAEIFDSMISDRIYREGIIANEVIEYLYANCTKNKLDRKLVEVFLEVIIPYPVGTKVRLSTGDKAIVISNNKNLRLRPVVKLINSNKAGEKIDLNEKLDINIEQVL